MDNITRIFEHLSSHNRSNHSVDISNIHCEPYQGYNKRLLAVGNNILIVGISIASLIVLSTCLVKKYYFESKLPVYFLSSEEKLKYYADMLYACEGLTRYYRKDITYSVLQRELMLNSPYHEFSKLPNVKDLKSKFPPETIYTKKLEAIKEWVIAYCEVYKTFSSEIYRTHMKRYMVGFNAIRGSFNADDWKKLEKVFGVKAKDIPKLDIPNPVLNYDGRDLEVSTAVSTVQGMINF